MTDVATLDQLYRHMEWADAAVWRCALDSEAAAADKRLRYLLHHIHVVQLVFRQAWDGDDVAVPQLDRFADLTALCRWGRDRHPPLRAFLDGLADRELEALPSLPWTAEVSERIGMPAVTATLGETLLQVALHSTHHRGQVCSCLRALGAAPPLVDFIAWVWRGKPAADWPV